MQRASAMLQLSAHALVLAFAALVLVAIGCTGAQATPSPQLSPAGVSIISGQAASPAPTTAASSSEAAVLERGSGAAAPLHRDSLNKAAPNLNKAAPNTAALNKATATSQKTACVPGRDTARMEKNAVSPPTPLLQHSPSAAAGSNAAQAWWDTDPALLSGRIPDALTHLDLGIVRT